MSMAFLEATKCRTVCVKEISVLVVEHAWVMAWFMIVCLSSDRMIYGPIMLGGTCLAGIICVERC